MAEQLKAVYNQKFVERLASSVWGKTRQFDRHRFVQAVFDESWEAKELKARMQHLTHCLNNFILLDYPQSVALLCEISPQFSGYEAMFFPEFISSYGLDDWEHSIPALSWLTRFSSSEFAVRPFIMKDLEKMMGQMECWSRDENEHVRRLSSEGCRPRLPWAESLPLFKQQPQSILPIVEQLKTDESLYVRRSVANNLNDISKDSPEIVRCWARDNLHHHSYTDWIIRHGCRSLLKQADPEVLTLFGYKPPEMIQVQALTLEKTNICIGETLEFCFKLFSSEGALGKVRIEYEIGYMKANGRHRNKVFKLAEASLDDTERNYTSKQSFRQMSTRKHYPGEHFIWIKVNGERKGMQRFHLHASDLSEDNKLSVK